MVDARDLEKGAVEVSVTVCTYNRETLLRLTLLSLAGQRCCSFQYEIVVVDDGSTDGTPLAVSEIASGTKAVIRYFREERVGVAAARNRAVLESRGRWIAFIDDDETADENWLSELMSCAAATGADCVGGSLTLQPVGGAGFLSPTTRKTLGEAR